MILAGNSIIVIIIFFCIFKFRFLTKYKTLERKVQTYEKIFTQRLFYYMLTALVFTITAIFALQTVVSQTSNKALSHERLEAVRKSLQPTRQMSHSSRKT